MPHTTFYDLSYEFFPPKTEEGLQALLKTVQTLSPSHPGFFSVTFGAGGSSRENTFAAVQKLQNSQIPVAPHLTCIGLSRLEITDILHKWQSLEIKRIVALRGDLPADTPRTSKLHFANELVKLIREKTGDQFHIAVAAYPEIHPQAKSAADDLVHLKEKMDAGANSAITQYFFNPDNYFYFIDECISQGISLPIIPGIMPITDFPKLVRFSTLCGAEIPRWIAQRLSPYSYDAAVTQELGFEIIYKLCERLLSGGAPGLHFYTLNQAEASLKLVNALIQQPSY